MTGSAAAAAALHIAYNHTSHGSQIISGMDALEGFPAFGGTYAWSDNGSAGLDLDDRGIPCSVPDLSQGDSIDEHGVTPWVTCTRDFLDAPANAHINVIMWSWCSIDGHDAQRYVDNMEILVSEYPAIDFVFMTGHAQGQGEDLTPGSVHYNNELIRRHCRSHERILFDFADIEAYDPDGELLLGSQPAGQPRLRRRQLGAGVDHRQSRLRTRPTHHRQWRLRLRRMRRLRPLRLACRGEAQLRPQGARRVVDVRQAGGVAAGIAFGADGDRTSRTGRLML